MSKLCLLCEVLWSLRAGLQKDLVSSLLKIVKTAKSQSTRETAVWALAIVCCNDEWNVVPQVWEQKGAPHLCEVCELFPLIIQ